MGFENDYKKLLKEFPLLKISENKKAVAVSVNNIYKHHKIKVTKDILEFATNCKFNPKNYNDYYYLSTIAYLRSNKLKKVAYPLGSGALTEEHQEQFDLEKWSSLVYKIYDAVQSGDMTYGNALDYYAGELDTSSKEDEKFKNWIKYYKSGEHLKYDVRAKGKNNMKKKADYQFPLNGSGFYAPETKPVSRVNLDRDKKKTEFDEWKKKLYVAIRRLDKLIRQGDPHMNSEIHADLADLLHAFDMEVRKVRMASTASDMTKRAALAFETNGLKDHANILYSLAQETPIPEEIDPTPDDFLDEEPEATPLESEPELSPPDPAESLNTPNELGESKTVGDALKSEPGAKPGEYEALGGNITIEMASSKLEEIAGKLADRRVIRLLAEFDIMLDKLGVAPMFPELPEAQSKLIDGYSYALTRVTKMLGMLSSGKSIAEIAEAKGTEIQKNVEKETAKTFNAGKEEVPKGTEAINEEFSEESPKPEAGEDIAKPAPIPPITEEV